MTKIRIIISRTDKIGDLVLSIPSLKMVRNIFPDSYITVLVRNYNYEIIKNLPYIDETIRVDNYELTELAKYLKQQNPKYFISLFSDKKTGYLARKSKAKYRIGPFSKWHSYFSYNKGIRQNRSKSIKNEAEYNLDLIKVIDKKKFENKFELDTHIYIEKKYLQKAQNILGNKVGKTVLIHPFYGNSGKNLSYEQYRKIIFELLEKSDHSIIISGHKSDEETMRKYFSPLKSDRVRIFINHDSILYLAAIIQKSDIFVGSSTGPTHIAGSLQKPIVAFYSPIKAKSIIRWGVFNNPEVSYFGNRMNCPEKYGCR
ncbi:MAG TPA: lipopolysaccharide heptosyltransferase family protein, partial [Candidatus Cloacimonetes bacterium]|nr:lipopolysaccharide heptosyltransferase family protein [Candidatus Cloacimonadota bacterium]